MTVDPALLSAIADVVGSGGVLTGSDVRARAASWFRSGPCLAAAIVRPRSTAELAAVVSLCGNAKQPVVTVGGNTGVVDGATAAAGDLLISTERMTRIEAVDPVGATITVEAGVPIEAVQRKAAEHEMLFPVDFGARGSATVGGAIATNAGGNSVLRYGMMREQVLGLEAVLADGSVVSSMNRLLKNNAGYDLKQLFIGTEGTLGIVTRAVLRLRSAARSRQTAFVATPSYDAVTALLRRLDRELAGGLCAFEVLWGDFVAVWTRGRAGAFPLGTEYPYYVLIEAAGSRPDRDEEFVESLLASLFEEGLLVDAAIAQTGQQRGSMWAIREDIEGISKALGQTVNFDVSVPITVADDYVTDVRKALSARWPDTLDMVTFGHLGDSNIHFIVSVDCDTAADRAAVKTIVYEALVQYDGSVSAEHGIGLEKRPYLRISRNTTEIRLMETLKHALDPGGLLNPGRVLG